MQRLQHDRRYEILKRDIVIASLCAVLLAALSVLPSFADGGEDAFVYRQGDRLAIAAYAGPTELTLTIDERAYHMTQTPSASGARYEADYDPGTVFWTKGDAAYITLRGVDAGEFELVRSYRIATEIEIFVGAESFRMTRVSCDEGVLYEAVDDPTTTLLSIGRTSRLTVRGEEQSKYELLSISPDEKDIFLSADGENFMLERVPYGAGVKFRSPDDPSTYFAYSGDRGELFVRGERRVGYDASPAPLPAFRVRRLGFGAMPLGVTWLVTSVEGTPYRGADISLRFERDAALYGRAPVNTFNASWIEADGRIIISGIASTKMAGPPDLMQHEDAFFDALSRADRFDIDGAELSIYTDRGKITALRDMR